MSASSPHPRSRLSAWFLAGLAETSGRDTHGKHTAPWWQVMCLTGVDYFSTLGYQPSIAFLAAAYFSPFATLVLVALTLFGALPVYRRIAGLSPHGQGSLSVLEERLPRWRGKGLVLALLGFAATSFIITITLSAADATAHILENPFVPEWTHYPVALTCLLVVALGAVFLKGFKEAIWLAVLLVVLFIGVNATVIAWELAEILRTPGTVATWRANLFTQQGNPWLMIVLVIVVFPKLALGLSGFETGVAVMPLVHGDGATPEEQLRSRIARTRKLLTVAAGIMSLMLIGSSLATTMRIPFEALQPGGEADGRALAYLAHRDFGDLFGTAYDLITIGTLWFAGASAMAGLLNLVPQYLRHRRPGADDVDGGGGGDRDARASQALHPHLDGLRLHDGGHRRAAAGRHSDRRLVHRLDRRLVARVARRPFHRNPHYRRGIRQRGAGIRAGGGGPAIAAHHRTPPEPRRRGGVPAEAAAGAPDASPARRRRRAVSRGEAG